MRTAAALLLPPPSPPPTGIRFWMSIRTPPGPSSAAAPRPHGRQVRLVGRHDRVVTGTSIAPGPAAGSDDVVVQVDGLEQGAQLVVAVLAQAEHLEAEVDLGVRPEAHRSRTRHVSVLPGGDGPRRRRRGGGRSAGAGRRRRPPGRGRPRRRPPWP